MASKPRKRPPARLALDLPAAMWLTLSDAIVWLVTGRVGGRADLPALSEGAREAAWRFLCVGGQTGKVVLSGNPHNSRGMPSNNRHYYHVAFDLSVNAPEDIDPRYFSRTASWVGEEPPRGDVIRFGNLRQAREYWPFPATEYSDVHVKRDDVVHYAEESNWLPPSHVSVPSDLGEAAVPLSAPARRSRTADPKADQAVQETHNILGREAERLRKQGLSLRAMATLLAKHSTNFRQHKPETIRRMLSPGYKPFVDRELPPLGT